MRRSLAGVLVLAVSAAVISTAPPAGGVAGFGDVDSGRFFTEPVQWMVDNEITTGTSPTCFSPDDAVTRGQAAAFLWRMEGEPAPGPAHPFGDVVAVWQQAPVSWMFNNEITTGTSPSTYSPDDTLTRGQMAALIHRAAGEPAAAPTTFPDVIKVWQLVPVGWMEAEEITTGTSPTTFSPDDPVTRGQFAAFSWRWKGEPAVVVDNSSPLCGGRDDFDGGLQAGWSWVTGDPALRSFTTTPGHLSLTGTPGNVSQVLVRDPATAGYEIETKVIFSPLANFQAAGLIVRQDADDNVALARGYCDTCGPAGAAGHGIFFDNTIAGALDTVAVPVPQGTDIVYLRIRHAAGTFTGSYSLDGSTWIAVASRDRILADPDVGIESGRSQMAPVPAAHFDYFQETAV